MSKLQIRAKIKKIKKANGSIKPKKKVNWDTNSFFKTRPISLGNPLSSSFRLNCIK